MINFREQRVNCYHLLADMARFSCPRAAKNWWAEHSQTLCRLGEVFLAFGSGVLTIVSFGSPFWIEGGKDFDHQGLWQECQSSPEAKCSSLDLSDVSGIVP